VPNSAQVEILHLVATESHKPISKVEQDLSSALKKADFVRPWSFSLQKRYKVLGCIKVDSVAIPVAASKNETVEKQQHGAPFLLIGRCHFEEKMLNLLQQIP
jgi:lysozyme family protein